MSTLTWRKVGTMAELMAVMTNVLEGNIEEIAEQAQRILTSVVPDAWCVAQEWDNRIDCMIRLPNGKVAGEMIALSEATEERIRETGRRLERRRMGEDVALENELWEPIMIRRSS